MIRKEYNLPLTKEAYEHLKEKIDGRLIEKTRYLIPLDNGLTAELDIFEGLFAGTVLAEVDLHLFVSLRSSLNLLMTQTSLLHLTGLEQM